MGRIADRGVRKTREPHRLTRHVRVLASTLAFVALLVPALVAPVPAVALRLDYPTWDEVVAAQRNEAAAKALRAQLEGQLAGLEAEVTRTQEVATQKADIYATAQQAYDEQYIVTQSLLEQTATAQEAADEAYAVAAQVISEMSKRGSASDLTPRLFTMPGSPDALLDRLEFGRVLGERYADLYTKAIELRNHANALAEQAEVASDILEELRAKAEAALAEAQAAAQAAADKLAQTEQEIYEMRARIEYLAGIRQQTTSDYNAGIKAQWGDGAEGEISQSGWARPAAGYISSHFGMRSNPVSGVWQLHTGTDLAGQGCGATVRAAQSGTVVFAGYSSSTGWGNYVAIRGDDGSTGTGYAHMQNGSIAVSIGQRVGPGQPIGRVGSTGQSTGCHLHFIVRVNGNSDLTDPVPFMRGQGITLG